MSDSPTTVFRRLVRDHMQAAPSVMPLGASCTDVVRRMVDERVSAAVIVDGAQQVRGILTEQDITRRIACRNIRDQRIDEVMTAPVLTIDEDDYLYEAVGFMRRHGLRHMPVAGAEGRLSGMLYLHDALAVAAQGLVAHIDDLTHEASFDGLQAVKRAQAKLAHDLLLEHVPAPEIQQLISGLNNDIYRRVLKLCLAEMAAEGWGPPPVAFACLVMGSGGRGESLLFPDQDNGFILADYPDSEHARVDHYFIDLALRMTARLDTVGLPLCRGGVMAINPVWRKTLPQWRQQIDIWLNRRHEVMLQLCDVFFDFRCVYGEAGLAHALRAHVTERCQRQPGFLKDLFGVQAEHRAAIGRFNRLKTERDDPAHKGKINLKHAGTLPLAEAVRLMALQHGVPVTGTLARIEALHSQGRINRNSADYLHDAFTFITGLQLRKQVGDFMRGDKVNNFVDPASLTERETDQLKRSFRAINEFRATLRAELTGDIW